MRIGIISDTHGHLDPAVRRLFAGVDRIVHAGDVGSLDVIHALGEIAPVTAVRGNVDEGKPGPGGLPLTADLALDGHRVHVVHRLQDAAPGPDTDIIVYGHTHTARTEERDGRLLVNPGAAGRQGVHRERSVAVLELAAGRREVRLLTLGPRRSVRA